MKRLRLFAAGILAFLIGAPLTSEALAQSGWSIFWSSLNLADSIASASDSDS